MSPDEQAIRDLVATWLRASKAHDHDAVLKLMADDVVFLQSGQRPICGRAQFAKLQNGLADIDIDAREDIREVRVFGDWAYCWNYLTIVMTQPGGAPMKRAGNVLSVLQKQGGRWVIVRDANMLAPVV
jgi:uncharacterized protein (TIGR02246 family)